MRISRRVLSIALGGVITLSISGCASKGQSYRLGQFTAISVDNVRNLDYDIISQTKSSGEDCYKAGGKPNNLRVQRAVENAIKNAHDNGVKGDILVNVKIEQQMIEKRTGRFWSLEPHNCIIVTGNLVKLK